MPGIRRPADAWQIEKKIYIYTEKCVLLLKYNVFKVCKMKSISVQFSKHKEYFKGTLSGELDYYDLVELVDLLYDKAVELGETRVFLDVSPCEGDVSIVERFQLAEKLSKKFSMLYRIFILERNTRINKMLENSAVNRGLNLLVSDDPEAGLDWLTG